MQRCGSDGWSESMVIGLRLSTGAVIRTTDILKARHLQSVPQSDLILWDPTELPALFQSGDFALVHIQAARAIIEIKRTIRDVGEFQAQPRKQPISPSPRIPAKCSWRGHFPPPVPFNHPSRPRL